MSLMVLAGDAYSRYVLQRESFLFLFLLTMRSPLKYVLLRTCQATLCVRGESKWQPYLHALANVGTH